MIDLEQIFKFEEMTKINLIKKHNKWDDCYNEIMNMKLMDCNLQWLDDIFNKYVNEIRREKIEDLLND
jgi:hypothetical protein